MRSNILHFWDIIKKILFLILVFVLGVLLWKNYSLIDFNLFLKEWWVSLILIFSSLVFISLKALMLFLAGRFFQIKENYFYFWRLFSMSSFFELTTFSGKLGSDGFKYTFWKDLSPRNRFILILFLRFADVFGYILLFINLIFPFKLYLGFIFVMIFFACIYFYKYKKHNLSNSVFKSIYGNWQLFLILSFISILSYLIILFQLSLVFYSFGLKINISVLFTFLFSHGLGALSQLPFGLGVKDYSIYVQLKDLMLQSNILFALVWVRLFGEMFNAILGCTFSAIYLKKQR